MGRDQRRPQLLRGQFRAAAFPVQDRELSLELYNRGFGFLEIGCELDGATRMLVLGDTEQRIGAELSSPGCLAREAESIGKDGLLVVVDSKHYVDGLTELLLDHVRRVLEDQILVVEPIVR